MSLLRVILTTNYRNGGKILGGVGQPLKAKNGSWTERRQVNSLHKICSQHLEPSR